MSKVTILTKLKTQVPEIKRLAIKLYLSRTAILVYQMGKVGSTTVYHSLKNQLFLTPAFHVHCLGDRDLQEHEQAYLSKGENPNDFTYLRHGKFLRKKLDEPSNIQWKIITLVRDPIARDISMFFQQIHRNFPNGLETEEIVNLLQKHFASFEESQERDRNWFKREIKHNFKINIYDFDFDKQKGYSIIKKENTAVLIIRLESLNDCFNLAIKELINGKKSWYLTPKNIGANKQYNAQYLEVVRQIKIPRDICQKIYSSQHIQHFYTKEMIKKMSDKWAKK